MLTDEQKEIVESKNELLAVTAFAGTGKTTSLCHFANARKADKILYLAFNKSMVVQAQNSFHLSSNVEARTIHSLAFKFERQNIKSNLAELRLFDLKSIFQRYGLYYTTVTGYDLIIRLFNEYLLSAHTSIHEFIDKLPPDIIQELALNKITWNVAEGILQATWKAIEEGQLSTPHNYYLKRFQLSRRPLGYDWIMVDEAQDINDCVIDIVLNQKSKIIMVGDPYQQIYGWNGASNAIAKVSARGAEKLYLTQSFRCPEQNEGVINSYLKLLDAPKRFIGCKKEKKIKIKECAFLARTNVGLFEAAVMYHKQYDLFYNGGFERYEFESLLDLHYFKRGQSERVKNFFIKSFTDFDELKEYVDQSTISPLKPKLALVDKYGDDIPSVYDSLKKEQAKSESSADLILSTTHKAKGLEYKDVTLADDFISLKEMTIIARYTNESNIIAISREEFHLIYVAVTRALKNVVMQGDYEITPELIANFLQLIDEGRIDYF